MPILLDTHCLLWLVRDDARLGVEARRLIGSGTGVHWSAISLVELRIKQMLGRLDVPADFAEQLGTAGLHAIDETPADADALLRFPQLDRHDPFDRMLLAQAGRRGMSLLTADAVLLSLGLPEVVDARR